MKFQMTLFLSLSALLLSAASPLFRNGKSDWKIVIPAKPHITETFAAEELRDTLKKISGATLPIEKSDTIPAESAVVIGTPATCPGVKKLVDTLKVQPDKIEKIAIVTRNGKLYLAGNRPRAALYAVYTFLQDQLGCRWFWDGPTGEYITPRSEYNVPELAFHYSPPFRFRVMSPCFVHRHVQTEIWLARNRANGASRTIAVRDKTDSVKRGGGHTVCVPPKAFADHPDWFSMIDGKRVREGRAGCWSNPGYFQYLVKKHVDMIRKNGIELMCAFPADITLRCQCPECMKNPDPSSRWFEFYHKLSLAVRKECPEVEFAGIAYQDYREIPATPVKGLEYVEYCQYNRCYVHKLDDPKCKTNRNCMAHFRAWQKKAPMGVYGYEFDVVFFHPQKLYLPFWNMTADAMKHFRDMKLVRVKTEMNVNQREGTARQDMFQQAVRIANYMYVQQMWNPDVDTQALLKDFCSHVYGAGGQAMYEYHTAMAASWDAMELHLSYYGNTPDATSKKLLNPKLVRNVKKWFADAAKAIDGMGDAAAKQRAQGELALEKIFFERWLTLYEMTSNEVTLCLPKLKTAADIGKLPALKVTSPKPEPKPHPTEFRMGWTDAGLHIQAVCHDPAMDSLRKGTPDTFVWGHDNIEIFLNLGDGVQFYQLAVAAGGARWSARLNDTGWKPDWKSKVKLAEDRWTVDITLPFKSFGGQKPKDGAYWKIVLLRNSRPQSCGYPKVVRRDPDQGAVIVFSAKAKENPNVVWITSPDRKTQLSSKAQLIARGWQVAWFNGSKEGEKADLSNAALIWIQTRRNIFSKTFYQEKLIPAVKNGAVLVYQCYGWINDLPKLYDDPSFAVVAVLEDVASFRRPTWVDPQLNTIPNRLGLEKYTTPTCTFMPKMPEKWIVLARQNSKSGVEKPYIIARPYGKGMIVITGDLYAKRNLFIDNIMEYQKRIPRPAE